MNLNSRRISPIIILMASVLGNAAGQGVDLFTPTGPESSGERELKAFAAAYPDRISEAALRDGEWSMPVGGEWFSWAHGRILLEPERGEWGKYARFRIYPYARGGLPPLPVLDAESAARLTKALAESRARPPRRSELFLERLYGAGAPAETRQKIVTVGFLGFNVRVHERIAAALREVAAECESARAADAPTAAFFAGLSEMDGYNYRDVAGTLSRSYHSYGLAVDLIPKSYAGKATYWRWEMDRSERWWATPYDQRWSVPQTVVDAFERRGFVWGGKWLFFDTMHFEYRPEILLLADEGW
jgi:hypothetical protein